MEATMNTEDVIQHGAEAVAGKAATIASAGSKTMWFGSGGVILSWFSDVSLHDIGVIIGIIMAIGGFAVNWIYKHKAHKARKEWYATHTPEDDIGG